MPSSAQALLGGIVDYAGTFPPAGLALADALAEYARARASADAWLLGRLIVPASSLHDFDRIAPPLVARDERLPWEVSVILNSVDAQQFEHIASFDERWKGGVRIAALEFGRVPNLQMETLAGLMPKNVDVFFETPSEGDIVAVLRAIKAAGASAKIRTGGVTADAIPAPAAIVRFADCARDADISFKATAGLHHALRGCYPLTDEPGSQQETMHGFLNLAVAAAVVWIGESQETALHALTETSSDAFEFRADGLHWRGRTIDNDDLVASRRQLFRSFGSCAFQEPADELRRLHIDA